MAGALMPGTEAHPDYDAAMRLVELSANPKERKEKLEELKSAQLALDEQQAEIAVALADQRAGDEDLDKRETAATAKEAANATLAQTLSDQKVALDQETSDRRALDDTTRSRLTDAARAQDRREENLKALAHGVEADTKTAKAMRAKAEKRMGAADEMIAALRDIVNKE